MLDYIYILQDDTRSLQCQGHTFDASVLKGTIHFTTISNSGCPYAGFFVIPNSTFMPPYIRHQVLLTVSLPGCFMQNTCSACFLFFGIQSKFSSLKTKRDSVWNTDGMIGRLLSSVAGVNFRLHDILVSPSSLWSTNISSAGWNFSPTYLETFLINSLLS